MIAGITPGSSRTGAAARPVLAILLSALCTALIYLAVGMPLAVLPGWVHYRLGYGTVIAGAAVSIQYAATIVSRAPVGPMVDAAGPKQPILLGFCCCAASGAILIAAAQFGGQPLVALAVLAFSRLALGFGESLIGTGAIAWAIGRTGASQTARIISWNGIAAYGGLAAGTVHFGL